MSMTVPASSIQRRGSQRLSPFTASARWLEWLRLCVAWDLGEYKLQVADSHRAALYDVQTCFTEGGDDFGKADVTMTVKMGNNASPLCQGRPEIDGQHSSTRFQNASYLASALSA
jgi:hypothetical protein